MISENKFLIGENIRLQRLRKGYSQEYLANKLGKTQNWLSKLEQGHIRFSEDLIIEVAKKLEIDIQELLVSTSSNMFINCKNSGQFVTNIQNDVKAIRSLLEELLKNSKQE